MKEVLKVAGMSCMNCVKAVETSVGELQGVSTVKADLKQADVMVEFDAAQTSLDEIKETIEDQGYDVKA